MDESIKARLLARLRWNTKVSSSTMTNLCEQRDAVESCEGHAPALHLGRAHGTPCEQRAGGRVRARPVARVGADHLVFPNFMSLPEVMSSRM